jgi:hypothetical protein
VRFDDFVHIGFGDVPIPDCLWVNHDGRTMLALIETAGLVGSYFAFEVALGKFLLELLLQFCLGRGVAASARISRRALIAAYENMFLKLGHEITSYLRDWFSMPTAVTSRRALLSTAQAR